MLVSPTPEHGTYAAAVEHLSPDVVEAIERALPCPKAADGRHIWDEKRDEVASVDTGSLRIRSYEWWLCVHCDLTSTTNPIPVDQRLAQVHSAAEHYSMLTYGEAIR